MTIKLISHDKTRNNPRIHMLILIAKSLMMIGLPVAATIIWQKRTNAAWSCVFFAFAAFAINYLWQMPLGIAPLTSIVISLVAPSLTHWFGWLSWQLTILNGLVYGLIREGIRWLMFRYAATSARVWHEGVLFGLGYTVAAVSVKLVEAIHRRYIITQLTDPVNSFAEMVMAFNDAFSWGVALVSTLEWGPPTILLNVGTSVAVLFSVRRRQVWLFLAAVLFYVMHAAARKAAWDMANAPEKILAWFDFMRWVGISSMWQIPGTYLLLFFLAGLPALCFALYLRKTSTQQNTARHKP